MAGTGTPSGFSPAVTAGLKAALARDTSGETAGPSSQGVPGAIWSSDYKGIATPQAGRPALTGGLQQMGMLNAFRNGQFDQSMNPYTPRPQQFLPTPVPQYDYIGEQNRARQAQQAAPPPPNPLAPFAFINHSDMGYPGPGLGATDGQDGAANAVVDAAVADAIGVASAGIGDGGGGSSGSK